MVVPVIVTLVVLFAASRAYLRYREGTLSLGAFFFWLLIWSSVEVIVWIPNVLNAFARLIGIGRGIDVIVYFSILLLFYLVYRIYVKAESIEREITTLVRRMAQREGAAEESNEHSRVRHDNASRNA